MKELQSYRAPREILMNSPQTWKIQVMLFLLLSSVAVIAVHGGPSTCAETDTFYHDFSPFNNVAKSEKKDGIEKDVHAHFVRGVPAHNYFVNFGKVHKNPDGPYSTPNIMNQRPGEARFYISTAVGPSEGESLCRSVITLSSSCSLKQTILTILLPFPLPISNCALCRETTKPLVQFVLEGG